MGQLGGNRRFAASCLVTATAVALVLAGGGASPAAATSTPDFSARQLFASAAPVGTGARAAWNVPGGRGQNVNIVDVEYSWNLGHEDLGTDGATLVRNGTPNDQYHNPEHGTAVLGILHAPDNGFGVTGLAPASTIRVVNAQNTETGYDVVHSIGIARHQLGPGDVLVVEQQAMGPGGTLLPIEWSYDAYQQIAAATAAGIIVVEPAGNGGVNLDDPAYAALGSRPDSGAIVVGAGDGPNCGGRARARREDSNFGSRVNVQGPGGCVVSAGYGDLAGSTGTSYYTDSFSGTSSATAVVAGVAAIVSSVLEARTGQSASPAEVRDLLVRTGTPQDTASGTHPGYVGPQPDVARALGLPPVSSPVPSSVDVGVSGSTSSRSGYWMLDESGAVSRFGRAPALGDAAEELAPARLFGIRAVKLEPVPTLDGYWIVDSIGRVFAFGTARPLGGLRRLASGERVTSLSVTPTGDGYWLFTDHGRVAAFGDASSHGDLSSVRLASPVVGSIATPSGDGYYMVGGDGGIFAFGDAVFRGSMGATRLNAPVRALVPTGDATGYWLVASDGGIFAFGHAPFRGSMGATRLNAPVTGMVRYGDGYLMVGADGGIFDFSELPFVGSLGAVPGANPIVSVASAA
ncbi:MAG: S8 family serine peptidase [Acidimicrobiia bacterium]